MIEPPVITQSTEQQMAYIHVTVPREQMREVMGPGITEVFSTLAAQGIAPAGPWFTHHLRMDPAIFDFEICVPVATKVTASGRVQPGNMPSRRVARTIYQGPYEGLGDAWGSFRAWVAANGHEATVDLWEIYAVGPESGPDASQYRTELNQPLA